MQSDVESKMLISVILPIYKVEKYLRRCVDSIISQTYKNLEIILVDDGSPDKCPQICDEYAKTDDRIKVIHKNNGGLSDARNAGTQAATGEYVAYIDSDDVVSNDYIEYLYGLTENGRADIACCDFFRSSDADPVFKKLEENIIVKYTGIEACGKLYSNNYLRMVVAWGKLIRTSIARKYAFPVGRIHEDEATTYKYYFEASEVVVGTQRNYCYFVNSNSIMGNEKQKISDDFLWAIENRIAFYGKKGNYDLIRGDTNRLFKYITVRVADKNELEGYIKRYRDRYFNLKCVGMKNYVKYSIIWKSETLRGIYSNRC